MNERMRLDSLGRLLIGRADSTGLATNALLNVDSGTSTACRINVINAGSSSAESTQFGSQNNDLFFNTSTTERVRITDTNLRVNTSITAGVNTISTSGNDVILQSDYSNGNLGVISSIPSSGGMGFGYGMKGGSVGGTYLSTTSLGIRRSLLHISSGSLAFYRTPNAITTPAEDLIADTDLDQSFTVNNNGQVLINQSTSASTAGSYKLQEMAQNLKII